MKNVLYVANIILSFVLLSWFVAVNVGLIDTNNVDKTVKNIVIFVGYLLFITLIKALVDRYRMR
jgi:formate hydrogenlyase subunit 4